MNKHIKAVSVMVEKRKQRKCLCFLLTIFHHFDVFYEVMNNHLTYNIILDNNKEVRVQYCAI